MATITSAASGNWSSTATWVGGVVPTSVDDVVLLAAHAITVDTNINVLSLTAPNWPTSTDAYLSVTTSRTLTIGTITHNNTSPIIRITASSPEIVTINGNINAFIAPDNGAYNTTAPVDKASGTCTLNINGILTGGRNIDLTYGSAVRISSSAANSIINIVGIVQGAGSVTSAPNTNGGLYCIANNCTCSIVGTVQARNGMAIQSIGNSPIYISGIITSTAGHSAIISNGLVRTDGIITNTSNRMAVYSPLMTISSLVSTQWLFQTENALVNKTLYSANLLTGYPLVAKVESGTVYGPTSEFTGTMLPWDTAFAQALATAQSNLQLPAVLAAITS